MRNRPLPYFTRFVRKENPPDKDFNILVKRYRKGGLKKYIGDDIVRLADVKLEQVCYTDPVSHEKLIWVYVGDSWWCRKRKGGNFEFARMVALVNQSAKKLISINRDVKKNFEVDGLWDCRRHTHHPDPEIIYKDGVRGYIVGCNQFEFLVEWEINGIRSFAVPVNNLCGIDFEFEEDFKKYSKLLKSHLK
jgi:hypothetical protein